MTAGKAWGHTVEAMSPEQAARYRELRQQTTKWRQWACVVPRCLRVAQYRVTYRYVTGRGGRVSQARREYCREHAALFSTRHGLTMPAEEPTPCP